MCDLHVLMSPSGFHVTKILPSCWVVWLYMCVRERMNQDNELSDSSVGEAGNAQPDRRVTDTSQ